MISSIHTRGKHYLARAKSMRRFTEGCHDPEGLHAGAKSMMEGMAPREVPPPDTDAAPDGKEALLLHHDDLYPESLPLDAATAVRVSDRTAYADGASDAVRDTDDDAVGAALARAAAHFRCPMEPASTRGYSRLRNAIPRVLGR